MLPATHGQIVVIDDNQDLADLFGSLCSALGYTVHVAYAGVDGVDLVQMFSPQVVFCDINMPGMDGLAVGRAVRNLSSGRKVLLVAITAWADAGSSLQIAAAGFDVHLTKPADFTVIAHMLNEFFASLA